MLAGFVHGVLNTDNINVTGESFDYGPWRFLPVLDPAFTAAYFDQTGLYAYGRQPDTLLWNLTRLAECLLPLADKSKLEDVLRGFEPHFHGAFNAAMLRRLGLEPSGEEAGTALVRSVWKFLIDTKMPFEQFFFDWYGGTASEKRAAASPSAEFYAAENFEPVFATIAAHQTAPGIAPRPPLFLARETLHDADRRGRGALGTDRRQRRLVGLPREARRHRLDARGVSIRP